LSAERLRMVDPTLTAVEHNTLVSGGTAAETGIVSNLYHRRGDPITEWTSGFNASSARETLWTAARHQGMRVGTLVWPGADARALDRMGDFGVVWPGEPLAASKVVELKPESAGTTGEVPSSDGVTPLQWRLVINLGDAVPGEVAALVVLLDANPDGRPRYDTVAARLESAADWSYFGEREWLELGFSAAATDDFHPYPYAAWLKALHIDRSTGVLRLYRGGVFRLHAYPRAFEEQLERVVGPWPGPPDERLVAEWWLDLERGIDLDTFIEQAERLASYIDRATRFVITEEDFDLLLAYSPIADEYQHASLLSDQLQWAYSPGAVLAANEGLKRIGRSVDLSVAALWEVLNPKSDALVVVSDHGMTPIFEEVCTNRVLADAGLVKLDDKEALRIAADTPMVTTPSGACVHLYLNLEGREPDGVVSKADAPGLLRDAARVFADLEVAGRPVVDKIFTRSEAGAVGLDSPNSGDLVIFLAPGFAASTNLDPPALEASRYYGQHGYLASYDKMCGMLFARGAGIKRTRRDELRAVAVAPMVATFLDIELSSGD
ncbi:MAG: alkaline phosphatase family protein, partial [Acidobacteriota bacterium]